ncbi:hypothetical protein F511_34180 [Dorcoceras hygrometricum]|uniref:Uncharacterized protein n=1 Tax=Dorcoceras hygrometricum TaxID=472368 RepID=A0A2Z7BH01_9LAMI|nr:hypothetical protein F511_34180 [Dorcoceras hygrometricum]
MYQGKSFKNGNKINQPEDRINQRIEQIRRSINKRRGDERQKNIDCILEKSIAH